MRRSMKIMLTVAGIALIGGCGPEAADGNEAIAGGDSNMGVVSRQSLSDYAIGLLERAAASDHPQLRANAIEGLQSAPELLEPYVRNGLIDENRAVRFVCAMTIGKFQMREVAPLAEPLVHDPSPSVQAAAIYALKRCGHEVDMNPLASMLHSDDAEVRSNAAMVLGELGNPSAAPMLEQVIGEGLELAGPSRSRIVDLQLAEALVKLGRADHVQSIRAALFYPPEKYAEITALACVILGRLRDSGAVSGLQRLVEADGDERRPAEVRMAAATGLAEMGMPMPFVTVEEYVRSPEFQLRYQAAAALGATRMPEALGMLQQLLNDEHPLVQVAAAAAIVRIDRG